MFVVLQMFGVPILDLLSFVTEELTLEVKAVEGKLVSMSFLLLFSFNLWLSLESAKFKSAMGPVLERLYVNREELNLLSLFSLSFSQTGAVVELDNEELLMVGLAAIFLVLLYMLFVIVEEVVGK